MILIHQPFHVSEKIGFIKERFIKRVKKVGEMYWNLWEMSMLEYEWRAKK